MNWFKQTIDNPNAWIAAIMAVLLFLKLYTILWVFIGLLIVLPQKQFSDWFKTGADRIRTGLD